MRFRVYLAAFALILCAACTSTKGGEEQASADESVESSEPSGSAAEKSESSSASKKGGERADPDAPVTPDVSEGLAVATFAGGCFWCMEPPFEKLDGVTSVVSGYCGGKEQDPTYKEVSYGKTGHTETVQITFDPETITYEKLLEVYWRNIDPTDSGGQFVDRGSQYRPAIFYHDNKQKKAAEKSKKELAESGPFDEEIVVEIVPASRFWRAEEYHQDFYKKSPNRYKSYRRGSGRDEFIQKHWGDEK